MAKRTRSEGDSTSSSAPKKSKTDLEDRTLDLQLITAASNGDLATVQKLAASVSLSTCDYDKRTPLHLAAAEGHLETVRYLVEQGKVDVNPVDRFGGTPVSDALRHRFYDVFRYLASHGGTATRDESAVADLCAAAKLGDLEKLQSLIDRGVDVNGCDYDSRTALHIAACEDQYAAAELLLKVGANVNRADRWGNTALHDAIRLKRDRMVELLKQSAINAEPKSFRHHPSFLAALQQVITLLCEKDGWAYSCASIPNDTNTILETCDAWYADSRVVNKLAEYHTTKTPILYGKGLVGVVAETKKHKWLSSPDDIKQVTFPPAPALLAGFKSGWAFPLIYNGELLAVLQFMSFDQRDENPDIVSSFQRTASSLVTTELLAAYSVQPLPHRTEQSNVVYRLVLHQGLFAEAVVSRDVDWYYNDLGLPKDYFKIHSPQLIAKHVVAFMTAKMYAEGSKQLDVIRYMVEESDYAMYFAGLKDASEIERRIESNYLGEGVKSTQRAADVSVRVKYYLATGTVSADNKHKVGLYLVNHESYVNPTPAEGETELTQVSTGTFLRDIDTSTRERYQSLLDQSKKIMGSVALLEEKRSGDMFVVNVVYRRGTTHSYFSSLTELINLNKLTCLSKFVQEFSNGYSVYRMYLCGEESGVEHFLEQANYLYILPRTNLFPLFVEGKLSPAEMMYAFAASRFVYNFFNQYSEEWSQLWEDLKGVDKQKNRLLRLKRSIKSEAATEERIRQVIFDNPTLVQESYVDFESHFRPRHDNVIPPKPNGINKVIQAKIVRAPITDLESQILGAFLIFNAHIVKTNFYKIDKSALSIQLDPSFLSTDQFPVIPYSIIFMLGAEFRGFHVRFQSVARGGLRLIISRNQASYQSNMESLFIENYNLAYTQQKKNKDIPEGGSKGTILLALDSQNGQMAFKKYIDAMLDLLLVTTTEKHPEIVDHFNKDDIIFCGPDENTADLMDWACMHAKKRGYKYATAFTTGKSQSLGGIPHDTYGMTTRGIHQFVLGLMEKKGLKEEDQFKVQTGGPDGDLGSNEILISKDKTKAIVDGSGVLYDPHGIDRAELTRLAKNRKMVENFDKSKLSKGGFLLLLNDKNVTLPDGFVVENGMLFRNSFHLLPYAACDFFVPCGGRPESISVRNVNQLIVNGVPIFKNIVEGANLFLTQEARLALEAAGIPIFKDASANKGGVTSSSLEVLAALALTPQEHHEYMCVKNGVTPPFYQEYVVEVQKTIEMNARLEFECLWRENQQTNKPLCLLTDILSEKVNELNLSIVENLHFHGDLKHKVLAAALPQTLQKLISLDVLLKRLPESYLLALLSAHLASRFTYEYGLSANQFAFWQFMEKYSTSK